MMKFTIPLAPISKKNSQRIMVNRATGKPFIMPSEQYKQYERDAAWFIPRYGRRIDYPVNIQCLFFMPTRRKVDLTNLLEAIDDVLVKTGVLADDNFEIVQSHDGSRVLYDKDRPRTEIIITTREVLKMKIKLDSGAKMPTRAHAADAGLDLYARETQIVPAKESAIFDTGVHIELPAGTVGMLKSKSGLNCRFGLTNEGVIDAGYTGSIIVKIYNNSGYDYRIESGDKISQLVILPILTPPLELVESLDDTERGNGGFGSTGK